MNRLHGKVALITGATGGLGQSFAQSFVREGANVILTGRDRELGERIASELGGSALFMTQDVSDPDDWTKVVEAGVERFGPITVLVNNAGVSGRPVSTLELSPEDYHQTINVDQTGTFYGMRAVIPGMIAAGGGSIINISSVAGIAATSGYPNAAYMAAKFAVRGLTKAAAIEYGPQNIRVNSVHPGAVLTAMTNTLLEHAGDEFRKTWVGAVPMRRLARPEEITSTVLFLASNESSYTTGAEHIIDGGLTAQ